MSKQKDEDENEKLRQVLKEFAIYRRQSPQPEHQPVLDIGSIMAEQFRKEMAAATPTFPELVLPCGKVTNQLLPQNCLTHILMTTPHPKAGHPVFWDIRLWGHGEGKLVTVEVKIDPLMLEATGLPRRHLGRHIQQRLQQLAANLPPIGLEVKVVVEVPEVLGTVTVSEQAVDHNCRGH